MAKIRLTLTLITSGLSNQMDRWVIDDKSGTWDIKEEVEIDVNDFKKLAKNTNDKYVLANLIREYVRERDIQQSYDMFINELIANNWIE